MEVFSFIFGICIGSFLNVLILRLPLNQSLLTRSTCPKCNGYFRIAVEHLIDKNSEKEFYNEVKKYKLNIKTLL